jgi:cell division protein FtsZ
MSNRGTALMGTGFGRGENRSMEAAQEAISSPLLDNISIHGAAGVLINITGGMDLAIDEVTTISSIIQDAAGDEAEIIFGAVHDSSMKEEVRVTVIATGFEKDAATPFADRSDNVIRPNFRTSPPAREPRAEVRPLGNSTTTVYPPRPEPAPEPQPAQQPQQSAPIRWPARPTEKPLPNDLEIPTFIRRQMD